MSDYLNTLVPSLPFGMLPVVSTNHADTDGDLAAVISYLGNNGRVREQLNMLAVSTTYTSNTTLSTIIITSAMPQLGIYSVELVLLVSIPFSSTGGGLKVQLTADATLASASGPNNYGAIIPVTATVEDYVGGGVLGTGIGLTNTAAVASGSVVRVFGVLQVTTVGNCLIQTAQNASSANALVVLAGSYAKVKQLA